MDPLTMTAILAAAGLTETTIDAIAESWAADEQREAGNATIPQTRRVRDKNIKLMEGALAQVDERIREAQAQGDTRMMQQLRQAQDLINTTAQKNVQTLEQGFQGARGDIQGGLDQSQQQLDPFVQGGNRAYQLQQALSGALGPQAQEQAFSNFQESPGVAFMREQGMQAINQNAAATGGLGGANRMKALSQFNQGLAQQDFANQFNRLAGLSQQGLSASSQLAGQQFTAGQNIGQARLGLSQNVANLRGNAATQTSGLGMGTAELLTGRQQANERYLGNVGLQTSGQIADIRSQANRDIANAQMGVANVGAQSTRNIGSGIGDATQTAGVGAALLGNQPTTLGEGQQFTAAGTGDIDPYTGAALDIPGY